MKKCKSCKVGNLLPFPVILAASQGDAEAISRVLEHYDGYITTLSTRLFSPDSNTDWHIRESDSVTPTMRNYSEHEHNVMCYEEPIYTLVAYIPCYYLWPWFSQQIQNAPEYQPGVYKDWFEGNYGGTNASFKSAWKIGTFINEWIKAGKPFDKVKAMEIYTKSMQYEPQVFTEADVKNE